METPGLQETVQLAGVFTSFLGEVMKTGMEGANLVFRGAAGIARGSYSIIVMAKKDYEQHKNDPSRFRRGSYSMNDMIGTCSHKGVSPQIMRIRNDSTTIAEFENYAHENRLAYSIMPDLNTNDEYIEIMYPSTQAIQYQNFMNSANRKAAFPITLDEYINNTSPDKQQEMQTIINNLTEEEKQLIKSGAEQNEKISAKTTVPQDGTAAPIPSEKQVPEKHVPGKQAPENQIRVSGWQIINSNNGYVNISVMDDYYREGILTVPSSAVKGQAYDFSTGSWVTSDKIRPRSSNEYTVKLNGTEMVSYSPSNMSVVINKQSIVRETNSNYIVPVPNTNGIFTAFDKRSCSLKGDNMLVTINQAERYQLLDRNFNFTGETMGKDLYIGHFDRQLVPASAVMRYNYNYQLYNNITVRQQVQRQPQQQVQRQPQQQAQRQPQQQMQRQPQQQVQRQSQQQVQRRPQQQVQRQPQQQVQRQPQQQVQRQPQQQVQRQSQQQVQRQPQQQVQRQPQQQVQRQPQQQVQRQSQQQMQERSLLVEVRRDMVKEIPGTDQVKLPITGMGDINVTKSSILASRDRLGQSHYFVKMPANGTVNVGNRRLTSMDAVALLRRERALGMGQKTTMNIPVNSNTHPNLQVKKAGRQR